MLIEIEAILIFGAISGASLALLALGFTLIYGVAEVVNFGHGSLFMFGAYLFFFFGPGGFLQLDLLWASILAIVIVAAISVIFYRLTIHPIIGDVIAGLVVTIAAALVFERLILLIFGPMKQYIPTFVPGFTVIAGVKVTYSQLLSFGISLLLFLSLWIFIRTVKIGKAMRAVAQDREVAMLMGINTNRVYMITMAISGALAATAGILITGSTTGEAAAYMWLRPLVVSFAVVVLGGLGSIKGTLVGAFIISYAETIFVSLDPSFSYLRSVVGLTIMVIILLVRPKGLFGKRIELEE